MYDNRDNRIPRTGVINNGKVQYRLMKCIGGGGSSLIYEAKRVMDCCIRQEQTYLVKELYPYIQKGGLARNNSTWEIFAENREAEVILEFYKARMKKEIKMADLVSAAITSYVDPPIGDAEIFLDKISQNFYIIYRKKGGMTLQQFTNSDQWKHLSYKERLTKYSLHFLHELCEALWVLHQEGYCHGDISPDNIFINDKGKIERVKPDPFLIDFNSCFPIENQEKNWIYSYKEGFSAPELHNPSQEKLDQSVDTYSLIAVFFYLLIGKPPKENFWIEIGEVEEKISKPAFEQLEKIFKKGLKRNPRNRYQDCSKYGELVEDLKELENRLLLRGGVTKAYLWEKCCHMYFMNKNLECNPKLLPPTKEEVNLCELLKEGLSENLALVGEAGIGKSSFLKGYLKKYIEDSFYEDSKIPILISLNAYNRYDPDEFKQKNRKTKDLGIKEEFLLLLELIMHEYSLKEEEKEEDQSVKEGLLKEFCHEKEEEKGGKQYILILEDFHSVDPKIKSLVSQEIENAIQDWNNVSFFITGRTEEAIIFGIDKSIHFKPLSLEQVIGYLQERGKEYANGNRDFHWIFPKMRDEHMQKYLTIPQFLSIYAEVLFEKDSCLDGVGKNLPKSPAETFQNYFLGDVRMLLSRNRSLGERYFSSDCFGISMQDEIIYSYPFIKIFVQLVLPALAFEMEKKPEKALKIQEFRSVIQNLIPLFPIHGEKGLYRNIRWMHYLEEIQIEYKPIYQNLWNQFEKSWEKTYQIRPGKAACEYDMELAQMNEELFEDQIRTILDNCLKILTIRNQKCCFFNASYQEFFCAYYYYQRLNYWERMGNPILEGDWEWNLTKNEYKYLGELILERKELIKKAEKDYDSFGNHNVKLSFSTVYEQCNQSQVCSIVAQSCYYNSKNYGKEEWLEEEYQWVKRQKELKDPKAFYYLALLEKQKSMDARKDYNKEEAKKRKRFEVEWMKQADEAGVKEAFYYMGIYYRNGIIVPKNEILAMEYFYRAVKIGDNRAIANLAGMLEHASSYSDPLSAFYYYKKGAEMKIPQALGSLARLFREGKIVVCDAEKEERYLKEGAMQLNLHCLCDLGDYYLRHSNNQNWKELNQKAAQLYYMAKQLNNNRGICSYAICLENGIGIEKDEKKAYHFYEKAKQIGIQQNKKAILCMAICQVQGKGVPKNKEKAKELLEECSSLIKIVQTDANQEKKQREYTREELLNRIIFKLYDQIKKDRVLIQRNYIEIEDYLPFF